MTNPRWLWQGLSTVVAGILCLVIVTGVMTDTHAAAPYQVGFQQWLGRNQQFRDWDRQGVTLDTSGSLTLDPSTAISGQDPYPAGSYEGGNYYNGSTFFMGEATSPVVPTTFGYQGAIPSWNVDTPPGTWVETMLRVETQGHWSKWYSLGIWASDTSTIRRHSVDDQDDNDAEIYTDLLVLKDEPTGSRAYQVKIRLFSTTPEISASIRRMTVTLSTVPEKPTVLQPGDPSKWGTEIALPECSQMVYPDGGEVWCSPTSLSMVLGYWLKRSDPCEFQVRPAVEGVYDWIYDGHGNWPFNTAYAAAQGLESTVARFQSMAELEGWIAAQVPVVFSFGWEDGELKGAAIKRSSGHLAVLVGFDAQGNPIVNDPAAKTDDAVKRTYNRAELESLWLEYSGGTVYLVHPLNWPTPSIAYYR